MKFVKNWKENNSVQISAQNLISQLRITKMHKKARSIQNRKNQVLANITLNFDERIPE